MAQGLIEKSTLTSIADSIRAKTGEDGLMKPSEMAKKIDTLGTGGEKEWNTLKYVNFDEVDNGTEFFIITCTSYPNTDYLPLYSGVENPTVEEVEIAEDGTITVLSTLPICEDPAPSADDGQLVDLNGLSAGDHVIRATGCDNTYHFDFYPDSMRKYLPRYRAFACKFQTYGGASEYYSDFAEDAQYMPLEYIKICGFLNYQSQGIFYNFCAKEIDVSDFIINGNYKLAQTFGMNPVVEELDLSKSDGGFSCTSTNSMFAGGSSLKTIKFGDNAVATNVKDTSGMYEACYSLVELYPLALPISWSLSNSHMLSDESIQRIVDRSLTVTTAQTLTLNSRVKARMTEEQIATLNEKGWTVA